MFSLSSLSLKAVKEIYWEPEAVSTTAEWFQQVNRRGNIYPDITSEWDISYQGSHHTSRSA